LYYDDAQIDFSMLSAVDEGQLIAALETLKIQVPLDAEIDVLLPKSILPAALNRIKETCVRLRFKPVTIIDVDRDEPGTVAADALDVVEMRVSSLSSGMRTEELQKKAQRLKEHVKYCQGGTTFVMPDIILNAKAFIIPEARALIETAGIVSSKTSFERGFEIALGFADKLVPAAAADNKEAWGRVREISLPGGQAVTGNGLHVLLELYRYIERSGTEPAAREQWTEFLNNDTLRKEFLEKVRAIVSETGLQDAFGPSYEKYIRCIENASGDARVGYVRELAGLTRGAVARVLERQLAPGLETEVKAPRRASYLSLLVQADYLRLYYQSRMSELFADKYTASSVIDLWLKFGDLKTLENAFAYFGQHGSEYQNDTAFAVIEKLNTYADKLKDQNEKNARIVLKEIIPPIERLMLHLTKDTAAQLSESPVDRILYLNAVRCLSDLERFAGNSTVAAELDSYAGSSQLLPDYGKLDARDQSFIYALSLSHAADLIQRLPESKRTSIMNAVREDLSVSPELAGVFLDASAAYISVPAEMAAVAGEVAQVTDPVSNTLKNSRTMPKPQVVAALLKVLDYAEPKLPRVPTEEEMKSSVLDTFQIAGILSSL